MVAGYCTTFDENLIDSGYSCDVFGEWGILVHSILTLHHLLEPILHTVESIKIATTVVPILLEGLIGNVVGALVLLVVISGQKTFMYVNT
ncbi:MAG: putative DNA repair protein MutK [Flavobacteriales bacterium]